MFEPVQGGSTIDKVGKMAALPKEAAA